MCHPENAEERAARRSGEGDQSDQYINLFTVGPITEESRKVTGKIKKERQELSNIIFKQHKLIIAVIIIL